MGAYSSCGQVIMLEVLVAGTKGEIREQAWCGVSDRLRMTEYQDYS